MTAKVLEDDGGIREIIQNARLLPIRDEERVGYGQMAPLEVAQQLWGRPGWHESVGLVAPVRPKAKRRRQVVLNDVTDPDEDARTVYEDDAEHRVAQTIMPYMNSTIRAIIAAEHWVPAVAVDSVDELIAPAWSPLSIASGVEVYDDRTQALSRSSSFSVMLDEQATVVKTNGKRRAHI